MSTEADILTELTRVASLLQQQIDDTQNWLARVRQREAELDEAWKVEMRGCYEQHVEGHEPHG